MMNGIMNEIVNEIRDWGGDLIINLGKWVDKRLGWGFNNLFGEVSWV